MLLANYITNLIKEKDITYVELSKQLGWHPVNIRLWAKGKNIPRKIALEDLAAFIDPKKQTEIETMLFDMRVKDLESRGQKRG